MFCSAEACLPPHQAHPLCPAEDLFSKKQSLYMHKVRQFTQPQLPRAHVLNYRCTILVSGVAEELEALLSRVLHQISAQRTVLTPVVMHIPAPCHSSEGYPAHCRGFCTHCSAQFAL